MKLLACVFPSPYDALPLRFCGGELVACSDVARVVPVDAFVGVEVVQAGDLRVGLGDDLLYLSERASLGLCNAVGGVGVEDVVECVTDAEKVEAERHFERLRVQANLVASLRVAPEIDVAPPRLVGAPVLSHSPAADAALGDAPEGP